MNASADNRDILALVRALADLSTVDLLFADRYLGRAEALLPTLCSREKYTAMHSDQERLSRLTSDIRRSASQGLWEQVHALAQQASEVRTRLLACADLVPVADAVYGPRIVHVDATTLGLSGVIVQPETTLQRARETALQQLRRLAAQDKEWTAFYGGRIRHFEQIQIEQGEGPRTALDAGQLRRQILAALAERNFARVARLTDAVAAEGRSSSARLRIPRPTEHQVQRMAAPFPAPAVERAEALGLAPATVPAIAELNQYLGCCCADRATLPDAPLAEAGRDIANCTCGHACPPEVQLSLRPNLDLLLSHPFISSAGVRYLPWFGAEALLIETFGEDDADARTELLDALGLPRRRGVSRLLIEDALLSRGTRLCADLGLDPQEVTLTCVPFDAYLRLAREHDWGRQELWTHFDGYQVTRGLHLWALVGGNARFGGPDDLSSLARDYDSDRLTARFAIVRRDRFLVRENQGKAK